MRPLVLLSVVLLAGFAGCAEDEQVLGPHAEKRYQGKHDTPAWGDTDRAAWEARIKVRQLLQGEDERIYRQ